MNLMDDSAHTDELGGDLSVDRDIPTGSSQPQEAPGAAPKKRWAVPVLAGFLVVSAIAAGVFGFLYLTSGVSSDEVGSVLSDETPEIATVSEQVANLLLNYDSTNLQEVSDQMLDIAPDIFREQCDGVLYFAT